LKIKIIEKSKLSTLTKPRLKAYLRKLCSLQKTNSEREEQKFRYEQALLSLSEIKSKEKIGAGHANLEKYFNAGLISAPLVIETHRQMIELIESTNDQELVAVDSLWRIYILDGTFLNQKI
jgi:hypothetical protein